MQIPEKELDRITKFMLEADKLKTVSRSGWVIRKVKDPEHVADHSYSTALLSYIMAKKLGLDANKCIIMALTHDLNEVITGDIATRANEQDQTVNNIDKARLEHTNMLIMLGNLDDIAHAHLKDMWAELKAKETKEAQLVDQVDKLDYILQLVPYHKYMEADSYVEQFFETAGRTITIPELRYIYDKIRTEVYSKRKTSKK
jgi:putative hydrolase of HD superfamily